VGIAAALAGACLFAQGWSLDASNFKQWFTAIVPTAEDCSFQDLTWRPSLWKAVVEANKDDKPILLWTMNGHPMACT
jgi:hypothetical protein